MQVAVTLADRWVNNGPGPRIIARGTMTTIRHAVIIGGGVGGLGAALSLSRAGHRVTLIERDATPTPTSADEAFAWDRRGAPQVRHSHALLARLHNLLRDQYPDVLERLLAAGATEIRFCDNPPAEMTDRAPREGDDELVAIACRRTTFEWVLRTTVLADERVTLLDGVAVTGLTARPDPTRGRPIITGVRLATVGTSRGHHVSRRRHDRFGSRRSCGSATSESPAAGSSAATGAPHEVPPTLEADLVVAATGRRSPIPRWLAELGVELETREEDTGIVYLSRFYKVRDGASPPEDSGPVGGDLGYLKYAVFKGDNHTFSVTFAVRTHDDELRGALLDPDTFERAARALPATCAVGRARSRRPHHAGQRDGRTPQPAHPVPRRRGSAAGAGIPRDRRRPHVHQPALRAGLFAGDGAGHAARRSPRHRSRRPRRPRPAPTSWPPARDRTLVPGRGRPGPLRPHAGHR